MDDYTLQQELEALAGNAHISNDENGHISAEPIAATMARWHKLFGLSHDEAIDRIMEHRINLTRTRVSDEHWESISEEKKAEGYDREAYEYELELQKKKATLPNMMPTSDSIDDSRITYLVELTGPLSSAEKVREAAKMEWVPPMVRGNSLEDGREVALCNVDDTAKTALLRWAIEEGAGYEPTILADPRSLR